MIKEKRIPTIMALILLLLGVATSVIVVQKDSLLQGFANAQTSPEQVRVTNITEGGFTVSWITQAQAAGGFVVYGENEQTTQIAKDDRDQISGQTGIFYTHHVSLKGLKPQTKYYFKINSAGKIYDKGGKAYLQITAPMLSSALPTIDPAYGTILNSQNAPADGVIVYLTLQGASPLSTVSKSSGNWLIALNNARRADLSDFAQYDLTDHEEELFVQAGHEGLTAQALTTTSSDSPTPEIILGKTYDFRKEGQQKDLSKDQSEESVSEKNTGFNSTSKEVEENKQVASTLKIDNPENEEKINTSLPEFNGTGPEGQTIQITVESPQTYSDTAEVDNDGNWKWSPPENLTPGDHKITISYQGKSFTRAFTVLAASDSSIPAFTATPSATLSPKPTIKPTPTPTPTPIRKITLAATGSAIPKSGNSTLTLSFIIIGFAFAFGGFILKFTQNDR